MWGMHKKQEFHCIVEHIFKTQTRARSFNQVVCTEERDTTPKAVKLVFY